MTVTIYHNARCSKSRDTLALLQQQGITPSVVAYLETPPSPDDIRRLLSLLGMTDARALMRKNEAADVVAMFHAPELSQEALIAAMAANPRLIERPIVVNGQRAAIGRPPENVLGIL